MSPGLACMLRDRKLQEEEGDVEWCVIGGSFRPVYGHAIAYRTVRSYGLWRLVTQWGLFSMRGTFIPTHLPDLSRAIFRHLVLVAGIGG